MTTLTTPKGVEIDVDIQDDTSDDYLLLARREADGTLIFSETAPKGRKKTLSARRTDGKSSEVFQLTIREDPATPNVWYVAAIANKGDAALTRQAIAPTLLDYAREVTAGTIRSSTNQHESRLYDNETISEEALLVWCELRARGRATFDAATRRFTLCGPPR